MKKSIFIVALFVGLVGFFVPFFSIDAATGVTSVSLNNPTVNGTTVSLTGTAFGGIRRCGGTTASSCLQNYFNCNPIVCPDPEVLFQTCPLNTPPTYVITNTGTGATYTGNVTVTSNVMSPSGCSQQCFSTAEGAEHCRNNLGLSLSRSGLPVGSYTVTVTTNDCRGTNSASKSFTISGTPCNFNATCSVTPTTGTAGVTEFAYNVGYSGQTGDCSGGSTPRRFGLDKTGDGAYEEVTSWTGAHSSQNKDNSWDIVYGTAGSRTSRGRLEWQTANYGTITKTCTFSAVTVSLPAISGSCSVSPSSAQTGDSVTWSVTPSGGDGTYTYAWSGTDSLSGTTQQVNKTYATAGTKTGSVTVTSGGSSQVINCSNSATISSANPPACSPVTQSVGVGVSADLTASGGNGTFAWTATGGTPSSGSGASFGTTYATTGTKTVTVTSNALSSDCTVEVVTAPVCSPESQTVGVGDTASLTASGGDGTFAWTATGGTPSSGSGASFGTTYATAGAKTVTVASAGLSMQCTVNVQEGSEGVIQVVSNVATTWTITGPGAPIEEATPTTSGFYEALTTGAYTLSAATLAGYEAPQIEIASTQNVSNGVVTTFTITYTEIPTGVDLLANGSDAPSAVVKGATPLLSWTSSNIVSGTCVASNGWSGGKADSGQETATAIENNTTYMLTCDVVGGGQADDSVTVPVREAQCYDGIDNDNDGFTDENDTGCGGSLCTGGNCPNSCSGPTCDDNEGDGPPECSDGIDNSDPEDAVADEDDPGCYVGGVYDPNRTSEVDPTPIVTQCNDGLDNDGDGLIDFEGAGPVGADDGCENVLDPTETADPDIREI